MLKPYVMTNHAKDRKKEFFPKVNLIKDFETVTNCSKEEIADLKNTQAYKNVKESKRSSIKFLKTRAGMYLIVEKRKLQNGGFRNFIITIIDLLNPSDSFISSSFKKQMIRAEYELEQSSKRMPNRRKNSKPKKVLNVSESIGESSLKRFMHKINAHPDCGDIVFVSEDFHIIDNNQIKSNVNNMLKQKQRLLDLAKRVDKSVQTSDIQGVFCNVIKCMNRICEKTTVHPLLVGFMVDGENKTKIIESHSVLLEALSNSLMEMIKVGKEIPDTHVTSAKNFFDLMTRFKEHSSVADQRLAAYGEQIVKMEELKLNKKVTEGTEIYLAELKRTNSIMKSLETEHRILFEEEFVSKLNNAIQTISDSGQVGLEADLCFK